MKQIVNQRGAMTTEFMVSAPFFFLLIFLIMEVSLMWVDKHFLRLAGFEAARTLIASNVANPCDHEPTMTSARRVAGFRMAAVAPSVSEILRQSNLSLTPDDPPEGIASSIAVSLLHLTERLPAAMVLTRIECKFDVEADMVQVQATYWRSAKMPLIKHIIWGIYVIQQLGSEHMKMESKYFGIRLKNPAARPISELRDLLEGWKGSMQEAAVLVQAAGYADDNWVDSWVDSIDGQLAEANQIIEEHLDATSKVITAVIYAVPEELRLVPITVDVALVRPNYHRKGKDWKDGQAVAVAPFTTMGEDSPWSQWVKAMQYLEPDW